MASLPRKPDDDKPSLSRDPNERAKQLGIGQSFSNEKQVTPITDNKGKTIGYNDPNRQQSIIIGGSSKSSSTPPKPVSTPTDSVKTFSAESVYADSHSFAVEKKITPVTDAQGNTTGYRDPYRKQSVMSPGVTQSDLNRASRISAARQVMDSTPESNKRVSAAPITGSYTESRKEKLLSPGYLDRKGDEFRYSRQYQSSGLRRAGYAVLSTGAYAGANLVSQGVFVKDLLFSPVKTTRDTWVGGYQFARGIISEPSRIGSALRNPNLEKTTGTVGGMYLGGKILSTTVTRASSNTKDLYVRAGSKYVAPDDIFSSDVLSGKSTMPLSKGLSDSISAFKSGRTSEGTFKVSTASPGKIAGEIVGPGRKGSVGLEDPGIYVTPQGQGSPYFLRVSPDMPAEYQFSMNPFKGATAVPTVTEFEVQAIKRLPRNVRETPGFGGVADYFSVTDDSSVYITKRSELGLGTTRRQQYRVKSDYDLDGMSGKAGQFKMEAGTSELEGVIPAGRRIAEKRSSVVSRIKGFDRYTTFEGRNVALREAKVLGSSADDVSAAIPDGYVPSDTATISRYSRKTSIRYRTPASALKYGRSSAVSSSAVISSGLASSVVSRPVSSSVSAPSISSRPITSRPSRPSSPVRSSIGRSSFSRRFSSSRSGSSGGSGSSFGGTPSFSGSSFSPLQPARSPPASPTLPKTKKKRGSSDSSFTISLTSSRTAYSPSVESHVFGIVGSKPSDRMVQTGLFTRPLLR